MNVTKEEVEDFKRGPAASGVFSEMANGYTFGSAAKGLKYVQEARDSVVHVCLSHLQFIIYVADISVGLSIIAAPIFVSGVIIRTSPNPRKRAKLTAQRSAD